jgi:carbon starvation protein
MSSLLIAGGAFFCYLLAYRFYGHYLAKHIFVLRPENPTPAVSHEDGTDFIPTKKEILFGHHFTSIAGTGPIVGPAIGVIWGWVPALIWVVLGPIFIGAVHDFGALVVSMRCEGKSIADILGKIISPRVRNLFYLIIFFELWIVIAIFALIIALLFTIYPYSVLAVWTEIPIALWVGWQVRKKRGSLLTLSIVGLIAMYGCIWLGAYYPFSLPTLFGISPVTLWMGALFLYAAVASLLPVDWLLQPRDFLNSHQLLVAMGLLLLGLFAARPEVTAPAYQPSPQGAPPLFPFLFIVIACGAVSGFHALVASGTTAKQLAKEPDALFIGYGSMLLEGGLAVLVLLACTAGLGMGTHGSEGQLLQGSAAFADHYSSWSAANGLGRKLGGFVEGSANMLGALGIGHTFAVTLMGVFIVSFAATTLDSATRIQRYVINELGHIHQCSWATGAFGGTMIAVLSALGLAFYSGDGKGAMALWPIFGGVNQLMACLALLAITVYLLHHKKTAWPALIPLFFMGIITTWAMGANIIRLLHQGGLFLPLLALLILFFQGWICFECFWILIKKR